MMRLVYITSILSTFTLVATKHIPVKTGGKVIVCTTSTASEFTESKFKIENSDLNLCTHLICIDNIWDKRIIPWASNDARKESSYKRYTNLRQQHPNLKVSLAAKYALDDYASKAASPERRQRFAERATDFVLSHKFNGLDLIWDFSDHDEYRYLSPNDKQNMKELVKELKKQFSPHNLQLTATFIADNKPIATIFDVTTVAEYFDYIHFIPKYNYIETWPLSYRVVDVLKIRSISNVQDSIDNLISLGVPSKKIILGLQFVGMLFYSILDLSPKVATFRRTMGYNEVCRMLTTIDKYTASKYQTFYDDEFGVTIATDETKSWRGIIRSRDVIVYESGRSIANKIKFALSRKLAGAMAFPIEMDDYRGNCGMDEDAFTDYNLGGTLNIPNRHNTTQPLLKIINFAFGVAPFEEGQARTPNKDTVHQASKRISDIEPVDDISAKLPDNYKPLIPLIHSANDAMVVGYDTLREKAGLYKKDRPIMNLLFNIPAFVMLFAITLTKMILK